MSLFRPAEEKFVGGKFLLYGETGSGKSTFILSFPKVGAIDTEAGLSNYEGHENLLFVANTSSHKDTYDAIVEINDNYLDKIETFAIDSETKIYDSMQITSMEIEERRAKQKGGDIDDANVSIRGWGKIKTLTKRLQTMKIDLSTRGIFIVSTAQASDVKKKVGDDMVKVGEKAEAHKSLPFDYDVVLRFYTEQRGRDMVYRAEVQKDRTGVFKKGEIIDNPSFEMWKAYYDAKKKKGTIDNTSYSTDVARDEEAMEQEDTLIEEANSMLKELMKSFVDNDDKSGGAKAVKEVYKEVGIKNTKQIDRKEVAEKVIEAVEKRMK